MTSASLWSFLAHPRELWNSLRWKAGERAGVAADPLRGIEIPGWLFFAGLIPVGGVVVWMAHAYFGVAVWLGLVALPLVFVLTLIGVNATALTSVTPHGALGKITQLASGVLAPRNLTTNIATASIGAEVAFQASNFIQNVKPGYMLGIKPRLQAVGHLIGAISGAGFGVAVFYAIFLRGNPAGLVSEEYPFPAVVVWKAVAEVLTRGLGGLPQSAIYAALAGIVLGVLMEIARTRLKERCPISPVGIGLAFVIPFDISFAMFAGAAFFWLCEKGKPRPGRRFREIIVQNQETICAGMVAGAALVGVGVTALEVF